MNQITTVFFDVGATLLTVSADEGTTFTRIARDFDIELDPDEVLRKAPLMYGLYEQLYEQDDSFWSDDVRARAIWIEIYEYLASLLGVPPEQRRPLAEAVYLYYFSPGSWRIFDDVIPTLDALQERGIRMGLISNWDSTLDPIIEGLNLSHYFETVLASAVVQLHKPMPEIFHLALERMDTPAANAMHVGDHLFADARGSAQVGMTPVLIDRWNRHPDYEGIRVDDLTQILGLL